MPRRLALALLASAGLLLTARVGSAADVPFPSHDVRIHITMGDDGRAEVSEQYLLSRAMADGVFQYLADPCTTIVTMTGSVDGRGVVFRSDPEPRGPWRFLDVDLTAAPNSSGDVFDLRYEAKMRGAELTVPIIMPASTLAAAEGERGAQVGVAVQWVGPSGTARVVLPRLEHPSFPDQWQATLLAMPSSVRVDVTTAIGGGPCDRAVAGTTGGLEWRFIVFVSVMAIWVPACLWWFGRRWTRDS